MEIKFCDYTIELFEDNTYSLNSADNIFNYDEIYNCGGIHTYSTKYGIKIYDQYNEVITSCLLAPGCGGGPTGLQNNSFIIDGNLLLICVSNIVFSISLPTLDLEWYKEVDIATAFAIYKMNEDFIIHGELEITRINKSGNIIWQISGSDIFVVHNNSTNFPIDNFYIKDNLIYTQSWDERTYCISYEGKILK